MLHLIYTFLNVDSRLSALAVTTLRARAITAKMATETPDVRNIKSWKEAFQYPIPTVRKVEQELRRDIATNREKLRSLVGYVHTTLFDECILTSLL